MFPQLFGKYILERELASGGMAVVYLATLRGAGGFEKRLVVKQIRAELASDEAFVRRFVAEAKTTVGLSHPNIVPVYELGVEQGVYFIAMELAQGLTLSELLRVVGNLSAEEGAYLGVEICRALDYAHRRSGIVHRDVTPRNVLIDDEGAVRLIDFGIAAPVSADGSPRERVYGSPGHMPTEQLRGGRLTPATDVFAVGALLVEAWTGEPPFRRATRADSDAALSVAPPPISSRVPSLLPLDELIARAVAELASERPQSAEDLARPLREFLRTADLGDIARRLGERVRVARRASFAEAGSTPGPLTPAQPKTRSVSSGSVPPPPVTPATRPITQPVTETFASRDEVEEWIRAPSVPPSADAPAPLGVGADASAAAAKPPKGPADLAATKPPRGADGASAGGHPVDEARARAAEPAQIRFRPWISVASLAAVVLLGLVGLRARRGGTLDEPAPHLDERSAVAAPSSPPSAAPADLPLRESSGAAGAPDGGEHLSVVRAVAKNLGGATAKAASVPRQAGSTPSSTEPSPKSSASGSADDTLKSGAAILSITSDLPAKVSIDGAPQGATPIRALKRPAGRHVISLVNVELDEHLTATVDAKPAATLVIHAEFTRPVPVLRVR